MKLKMYFALLALSGMSLQSCDNDNQENLNLPTVLQQSFSEKYPAATRVEWEVKAGYYEADFTHNNTKTSAWFTPGGIWEMTETDIPYDRLPTAVKTAFKASTYSAWHVEDVDQLERKGMEVVYILEVEAGEQEVDLYYSADGVLIKAVNDTDRNDSHTPSVTPPTFSTIEDFIKEKYLNARITEIDVEHGQTEVDIIHDQIGKEVRFNSKNEWVSTSWDVYQHALPVFVTNAIKESPQYGTYAIDDAEFVETPTSSYYLIELEKRGLADVKVKINSKGEFIQ